jgi:hypothetical protein
MLVSPTDLMMKNFAQEIAQIRNPFEKYGEYPYNDRILFKRVHDQLLLYS